MDESGLWPVKSRRTGWETIGFQTPGRQGNPKKSGSVRKRETGRASMLGVPGTGVEGCFDPIEDPCVTAVAASEPCLRGRRFIASRQKPARPAWQPYRHPGGGYARFHGADDGAETSPDTEEGPSPIGTRTRRPGSIRSTRIPCPLGLSGALRWPRAVPLGMKASGVRLCVATTNPKGLYPFPTCNQPPGQAHASSPDSSCRKAVPSGNAQ
jgi:hypothetical protein